MKGSDILVKCLEEQGVERVFGIPGEENLDFMDSLVGSNIDFILTRHESSAAFMAGMVGRLTSRPGACLTTLGPGAANIVIGVGEAYLGYCPMVAMSGQLSHSCHRPTRKQYLDLMSMFRPITKGVLSPANAEELVGKTREAFSLAAAERPGPVYLELPEDVMKGSGLEPAPPSRPISESAMAPDVSQVREWLAASQHPIILAGSGVVRGRATAELIKFAERWNVPVAMTWLGTGSVPFDHPLSLGTVGLRRADLVRRAFEASDLVLLVGFDIVEFEPLYWNFGTAKKVAYMAAAPCNRVPGFQPDLQVIGDVRPMLSALSEIGAAGQNWTADLKIELKEMLATVPNPGRGVKPQAIVRAIRSALGKEDVAVSDVGAHLLWMAQRYPVYKENTLLMSNALIPMGVGVPWAIAAKLVNPERKIVASVGDGSFAMTGMELLTAKEQGTPLVVVVWNDSELGLIRIKQEKAFGRSIGVRFGNPDLVGYAKSLGVAGYRASSSRELEEVLTRCLKDDELAVIDVAVDASETSGLSPS
ncbi:MAG: acetolactate synthase large subunit [Methanomassiliicoccus sp.]|nr:acetolactate synthase large subunit [Methanomassiliicoccus sp.]